MTVFDDYGAPARSTATATTVNAFAICRCCSAHGNVKLLPEIVTCPTCGGQCSCDGCVAEADPSEPQ